MIAACIAPSDYEFMALSRSEDMAGLRFDRVDRGNYCEEMNDLAIFVVVPLSSVVIFFFYYIQLDYIFYTVLVAVGFEYSMLVI